jgi:nucleotide-binding universal stress UspA family protein
MKILLAVDGSAFSKKMLAYLATHESLFVTSHAYTVVHVHPPLPARARAALGKEVVESYYDDESAKVLDPIVKFLLRHGITPVRVQKIGHPGEVISKLADQGKFDMVVMGSHGHGALVKLVTGSVATEVLAHCKVPVLLVR